MSGETSPAIARYAAPKRPSGVLILVVVFLLIAVGVVVVRTALSGEEEGSALPSVTTPTPSPTPQRSGGTGINAGGVVGYWKFTSERWDGDTVTLGVEIAVDEGVLYYEFYAFDDVTADILDPRPGAADSLDARGYISPGQTLTGSLTFRPRVKGDLTVVMSDGQTQLSALRVEV
jgi:hypothetical protein